MVNHVYLDSDDVFRANCVGTKVVSCEFDGFKDGVDIIGNSDFAYRIIEKVCDSDIRIIKCEDNQCLIAIFEGYVRNFGGPEYAYIVNQSLGTSQLDEPDPESMYYIPKSHKAMTFRATKFEYSATYLCENISDGEQFKISGLGRECICDPYYNCHCGQRHRADDDYIIILPEQVTIEFDHCSVNISGYNSGGWQNYGNLSRWQNYGNGNSEMKLCCLSNTYD